MRSIIFALLLASVECQKSTQVCKLDNYQVYHDDLCQKQKQEDEEEHQYMLSRINQITADGTKCQYISPEEKGQGTKIRITCLSSQAFKAEIYNDKNEDPGCKYAYSKDAPSPSFIVKNGGCVRTGENDYVKMWISTTTGKDETTDNSWEIDNKQPMDWDDKQDWNDKQDWDDKQEWDDDDKDSSNGMSFSGDNYEVAVNYEKDRFGNDQMTTEMKFDKYFMYGIDNMGGNSQDMPPCGPGVKRDACKRSVNSKETCCAHVATVDNGREQQAFYRCMNQKLVDASFAIDIDGIKMSMGCSDGRSSQATYFAAQGILLSAATLATMSAF